MHLLLTNGSFTGKLIAWSSTKTRKRTCTIILHIVLCQLRNLCFKGNRSTARMVNRQLDTVGNQDPPYSMVFSGLSNNCRIALRLALNISDVNHYIIFQYFIRSQSNQFPICGFQRIFFKGITLNILRHPACLPVWLFFRLCRIRFFIRVIFTPIFWLSPASTMNGTNLAISASPPNPLPN